MLNPNYVLLYVESPTLSAAFYGELLEQKPVESSPGFAMFVLPSGLRLALWARGDVAPAAQAQAGAVELGFPLGSKTEVDALHARWKERGLPIAQPPTEMDFGRTFVALDPDGHRLRPFALA